MTEDAMLASNQEIDPTMGRRDLSEVLLGLPLLSTIGIVVIRGSRHFSWDWPTHAHHHLLANIATAVGLAVVSLLIVRGPLRAGATWAWWALAVAGAAIFGGYWLGNVTVGFGEAAAVPNTAQAILALLYVAGLVAARRRLRSATVTEPDLGGRHVQTSRK